MARLIESCQFVGSYIKGGGGVRGDIQKCEICTCDPVDVDLPV